MAFTDSMMPEEAVEFTRGTRLDYRVWWGEEPGPWRDSLLDAVDGLVPVPVAVEWPKEWAVFASENTAIDKTRLNLNLLPAMHCIPSGIKLEDETLSPVLIRADFSGLVDLTQVFGPPKEGRTAILMAELILAEEKNITVHAGADWWMRWWVDGTFVFDTLAQGNRRAVLESAHPFELCLRPGKHLLAVEVIGGAGGWAFASEATSPSVIKMSNRPFEVECRKLFYIDDPSRFRSLSLRGAERTHALINFQEPPVPDPRLDYQTIPAIPVSFLKPGANLLTKRWDFKESSSAVSVLSLKFFRHSGPFTRLQMPDRLYGLPTEAARLVDGPLFPSFDRSATTVVCRTNMPIPVRCHLGEEELSSPSGLYHRFLFKNLPKGRDQCVTLLTDSQPPRVVSSRFRTLPSSGPIEILLIGDPSPNPRQWRKTVEHVLEGELPDGIVFLGDATSRGTDDWRWSDEFLKPASELFSRVPVLGIPGNHDENSPLFAKFLMPDENGAHWSVSVRNTRLIGLIGERDWAPGGNSYLWLETQLRNASDADYIFVFNHYPPWTSTSHGAMDADGRPVEPPVRQAREFLLPLLLQHEVTALVTGHSHCYERSEISKRLTLITSGGAGGYLYPKVSGEELNPHSVVFASAHHIIRLKLDQQGAGIEAIDRSGFRLDTRDWQQRKRGSNQNLSNQFFYQSSEAVAIT